MKRLMDVMEKLADHLEVDLSGSEITLSSRKR